MTNKDPSFARLYREAKCLRDHLLRLSGHDGVALSSALRPFEKADNFDTITDEEINALSEAFQKAHDDTATSIDNRTLANILAGKSPHLHNDSALASAGLAIIGFILVISAFHYTYWANRTQSHIAQAERFLDFDHSAQMMKVVELEALFTDGNATNTDRSGPIGDIDPELVYLEQLAALEAQYELEASLPSRLIRQNQSFNPLSIMQVRLVRSICTAAYLSDDGFLRGLVTCDPNAGKSTTLIPVPGSAASAGNTAAVTPATFGVPDFRDKIERVNEMELATMKAAGRIAVNRYTTSIQNVDSFRQELVSKLSIVRLWALPIIYGALGSIVYCMWRVLDTNVSGLGFALPVVRTIFAALAALTFSMLLVPANILTVGAEMNRPIIYLLSFIFGYSIEAFISTLNVINTYVTSNMAVKGKKPA